MIERKFVEEKLKEYQIQEYIGETLGDVGHSHSKVQKTALGERIVVHSSRPGLVVGRKGENIKRLTRELKAQFNLENPQIEISEVTNMFEDAKLVADRIKSTLERFGSKRFKGIGHQMLNNVMGAGALGVEILISGKVPSARARTWRFYQGYLKKCGDVAVSQVDIAYASAHTKMGTIGIKVSIMPSDITLPDSVTMLDEPIEEVTAVEEESKKAKKAEKKEAKTEAPKKPAEKVETPEKAEEKPKTEEKEAAKEEKAEAPKEQVEEAKE